MQLVLGIMAAVTGAAPVYADMTAVIPLDAPTLPSAAVETAARLVKMDVSGLADSFLDSRDPRSMFVGYVTGEPDRRVRVEGSPPVVILTDRRDSMALCLCALMGLGLCKSAPWVRRFNVSAIPGWYHDVGPLHIGQRLAIPPDCTCSVVACFYQPSRVAQHAMLCSRRRTVAPVWRMSQTAPTALAGRGPPHLHSE